MSKEYIGIVGHGFVGGAVARGFLKRGQPCMAYDVISGWHVAGYDKLPQCDGLKNISEHFVEHCEVIFVCVPTPMNMADGACDTSIVNEVLWKLNEAARARPLGEAMPTVIIKSTVPPGSCRVWQAAYQDIGIVFNPEFLRENFAQEDFDSQTYTILGGEMLATYNAAKLYERAFGSELVILRCTGTEAEFVKYATNAFLATKVALANEFAAVCDKIGVSWEDVATLLKNDQRLGATHWDVPGPDGKRGFGGKCFPKDLNGMMHVAKCVGVDPSIMNAAWALNLQVRGERDWENIEGAVKY